MNFHDFHFLRPWWLLAFPLGFVLLNGLRKQEEGKSQWDRVCDRHLLESLLVGKAETAPKMLYGALLFMLLLATLALGGPTWERRPQPLFRSSLGRVIVLDLSLSMASTDLSPNRLSRARYKAIDLIKAGVGIDQGLVVFAGDAFIVTPLTDDRTTILNLLPGLDTDTVPVQGSRADRGLEKAGELLRRAAISRGQIILIADDADAAAVTAAEKLKKSGCRVDVIGVGTKEGAPVPLPGGGYLKDDQGNIVVPIPDFAALKQVAARGGGRYCDLEAPDSVFQALNQPAVLFPKQGKKSELTGDQWLDRGPWLLLPLVLMAAFCFRRGWLLLILAALLAHPLPAAAFSWQNLWQRPDQQAAAAFKQKNYEEAARLAENPAWKASALYRAGKFKEAAAALQSSGSANDFYNRGNALARAGKLQEALAAYDQALELDPQLEDARFNRQLVEKLLKQQHQQQQQKNQDSSRKNDQQQQKNQQQRQKSGNKEPQESNQENQSSAQENQQQQSQHSQSQAGEQQQDEKSASRSDSRPDKKAHQSKDFPMAAKAGKKEKNEKQQDKSTAAAAGDEKPLDAKEQALEQWLRRVPDDPGGLLKRKFFYQYRARQDRTRGRQGW